MSLTELDWAARSVFSSLLLPFLFFSNFLVSSISSGWGLANGVWLTPSSISIGECIIVTEIFGSCSVSICFFCTWQLLA